jgi:uncharacterized membrane protein
MALRPILGVMAARILGSSQAAIVWAWLGLGVSLFGLLHQYSSSAWWIGLALVIVGSVVALVSVFRSRRPLTVICATVAMVPLVLVSASLWFLFKYDS